jgi:hypothetical protein
MDQPNKAGLYLCELEKERAERCKTKVNDLFGWKAQQQVLHGDAFHTTFEDGECEILYLNPPYDFDPKHVRLEQKFLSRFTQALRLDGVLVFVVPHYALSASAELLAKEYKDLVCLRFPDPDYATFKQVVVFARRSRRFEPDPVVVARVQAWADSVEGLPILGETSAVYEVKGTMYTTTWKVQELDLHALVTKARPWHQTTREGLLPVPHTLPTTPPESLLWRRYTLATPPRPAHIASGLATGLFNGLRITPDSDTSELPDLLVKGTFEREFVPVEDKLDAEGVIVGTVEVERPRLSVTCLNLSTGTYQELGTPGNPTLGDLLANYRQSLMAQMRHQCPVLYDPQDPPAVTLKPVRRKLYKAQEHSAKAILKLLEQRETNRSAILLGEIGSGKTSCVLAVAKTIAKTVFVMCPPHLLDTWKNEIKANVPEARVRVLKTIDSVDRFAEVVVEKPQLTIAIVSRESAKLGHGWEGVGPACPKCGAATPDTDLARKRAHCEAVEVRAEDRLAKMAWSLAATLSRYAPGHSTVRALLRGRHWSRILSHRVAKASPPVWSGIEPESLTEVFDQILENPSEDGIRLFFRLLAATKNPAEVIPDLVQKTKARIEASPYAYRLDSVERVLGLFLPPNSDLQRFLGFKFWDHDLETIVSTGVSTIGGRLCWAGGTLFCDNRQAGSVEAALALLDELVAQGKFTMSESCGEPLFGASAPRRYSLSKYIVRHHPSLFDLLIIDEAHEYSRGADTAQGLAAHKLVQLGIPTIFMTGSLMNGYARSLFMNLWSLSPEFRREFNRSDLPRFVDRYGYRKRLIVEEQGEVVAYGSVSDRVMRGVKMLGDAPGVLPLLLFRHLLPISVTLHKSDLALELPRSELRQVLIDPDPATKAKYDLLVQGLMSQIQKDQFDEKRSGKLFGALAEIPSYLDRATSDTGNTDYGDYEIRYPASIGAELVASASAIPESARLTKETWLLDTVQQELDEGRRVLVFSWHTCLLPRLARILSEHIMEPVQVLYADKVPTGKRQQWIDDKVVKRGVRVMVANPLTVQTGLNNLVHFATEIWHENPACNPLIFRQAIGRVDRIGQTLETRILVPVYRGTMQETVYDLLLHKVATSTATDGVDPSAALMAVGGVEENYSAGLSLGRELWSAWTRGAGSSLVQAQREKRSA